MFYSIRRMIGFRIKAIDGLAGKVEDFYFDDETWGLRYLVARIGGRIRGREVLVSPPGFNGTPDWKRRTFPLTISREKVRNSPDVDRDQPVSRQKELELLSYYGSPIYWQYYSSQTLPPIPVTPPIPEDAFEEMSEQVAAGGAKGQERGDVHLRSFSEVEGYALQASDGRVGALRDLLVDFGAWGIRYLAADINSWMPGGHILIDHELIGGVSWAQRQISVELSVEQVKNAPPYEPGAPVDEEYEKKLLDYYGSRKG